MSDGIAIAIDKVGEPDPKAPEAKAGAPTVPTAVPESEESKADEEKPQNSAVLRAKVPRPVEVTSVPETPVDDRTPAGGTPRPELKLDEEPKEKPKEEAQVILGPGDVSPETAAKDQVSVSGDKAAEEANNGSSNDAEMKDVPTSEATSDSGSGEKRKLDEEPVAAATNGKKSKSEKNGSDERIKKAKVDYVPAPLPTNGKNGKAKREKKFAPAVGRTARKTRSQGPVEV